MLSSFQPRSLYLVALFTAVYNVGWSSLQSTKESLSNLEEYAIGGYAWEETNSDSNVSLAFEHRSDTNHPKTTTDNHSYPFSFAACLIAKDDNPLLPEWIAYHYTVMPLRALILAVDPLSVTSPMPIIERFRQELPDLTIKVWTGNAYFYDGRWSREKFANFDPYNNTGNHAYIMHLQRQNAFYATCLRYLKGKNKKKKRHSWTLLIDTDEFFTYNSILPVERQSNSSNLTKVRESLPAKIGAQNETVAHWIANDEYFLKHNMSVCMYYPRLFFSAHEEATSIQQAQSVPNENFSTKYLHTLRYRSHWDHERFINGKSMVHAGNYNGRQKVGNPHEPFGRSCSQAPSQDNPFRVHHYSGSLEAWLSGFRRDEAAWETKNNFTIEGHDDSLSEWFHHFVALVGEKAARRLVVEAQEEALQQSYTNKYRVEVLNETLPFAFAYDRPGRKVKSL